MRIVVVQNVKETAKAVHELTESYVDAHRALKTTARESSQAKKLWREGNQSKLIKIGVACIVFPDPSPVGEIIGAGFLLAGAVQKGIRDRSAYLGDVRNNLDKVLKELNSTSLALRP